MLLSDRFLGFFMVPAQSSWNYNFMGMGCVCGRSVSLGKPWSGWGCGWATTLNAWDPSCARQGTLVNTRCCPLP